MSEPAPFASVPRMADLIDIAVRGDRLKLVNKTRNSTLVDRLEVAATAKLRNKGLLGRNGLAVGEALWIIPCEAIHTFWMRFSIDLIYVDRNQRVAKVRRSVPPWRISGCLRAHSVIELPAGTLAEGTAEKGDELEFLLNGSHI